MTRGVLPGAVAEIVARVAGKSVREAKVFAAASVIRMMRNLPSGGSARCRVVFLLALLGAAAFPVAAGAAWQVLLAEPGKRIEIDPATIVAGENGLSTISSRIVLERPVIDPKTSSPYRIIEVAARYDCTARTHATLKRSYYKDEGELLREEEIKPPLEFPVRTGSPEDRVLRDLCRPKPAAPPTDLANKIANRVSDAAGALRRENEQLVARQVQKELTASARKALAHETAPPPAKRSAATGRDAASGGKGEHAVCASGRQQSPIDLAETIAVDLEAIQFAYRPAPFRVADSGRGLQMNVYGGGFGLLGKTYSLLRVDFRRPSETRIGGKAFDMEAQLVHRAEDGKLAIVSILLESGSENPVIQTALNNLPLARGGEVSPPGQSVDVEQLLPSDRRYYAFIGSLTSPPCTEDVLWLVLKKPQPVSPEQQAIFARLYAPNARPLQPAFDRIIKESR